MTTSTTRARSLGWEVPLVGALAALVFVAHDVPWVLDQPFWLDESWVAVSTRFPLADVPGRTSTTPVGFTLLLRAVTFGGEQRYRLLPLAFSGGSVIAAYCLARLLDWRDRRYAVLAGLLAGGAALLVPAALYRNDLKQYTAEAFVALAVLALTARAEREWSRKGLVCLAAAVIAAKLISHTAVFVGAAVFISLTVVAVTERRWRAALEAAGAGAAAGLGMFFIYLTFDRPAATADLENWWAVQSVFLGAGGFPPTDRGIDGVVDYISDFYPRIAEYSGLGGVWLTAGFVLAGLVTLVRGHRRAVALAIPVLLAELLVAGIAGKYPLLELRTSHFAIVTVAVVAALGVAGLAQLVGQVSTVAALAVVALAAGLYLYNSEPYLRARTDSIRGTDVPGQTRAIAAHSAPGDAVVVAPAASFGFGYYWKRDRPAFTDNPTVHQRWTVAYPTASRIVVARDTTAVAIRTAVRQARRLAAPDHPIWIVRNFPTPEEESAWTRAAGNDTVTSVATGTTPLLLMRRLVGSAALRRATLTNAHGKETISWLGRDVAVSPDALKGSVDTVTRARRPAHDPWVGRRRRST